MKSIVKKSVGVILVLLILLTTLAGCVKPNVDNEKQPSKENDNGSENSEGNNGEDNKNDNITEHTHIYEWVIDIEPTYITPGIKHKECACGDKTEENTEIPIKEKITDERNAEINAAFDRIQNDAEIVDKIELIVVNMDLHYDLMDSGEYDGSRWTAEGFGVFISCNYKNATAEEWYKLCDKYDNKSINQSFYDYCKNDFSKAEFINSSISSGLNLEYSSLNDFFEDYSALISLSGLKYVTKISITYCYSIPYDWMTK